MSYPSSIPSYQGFTSTDTLAADNHAAQHNQEQSDISAIATKVGTGSSTPTNNTVLRGNGTGTTTYDQVHLDTDVKNVLAISNGGTGSSTASQALINLGSLTLQQVYPIGCIYTETTGVNPNTTFGFGTWSQTGQGRVLVGQGTSDQTFNAGATGGESNHKLTIAEMPAHTHSYSQYVDQNAGNAVAGSYVIGNFQTGTTGSTGGDGSHNNLQPYLVVFMWTRTS